MSIGSSLQHLGVFSGTVAKGARINFELPKRGTYNSLHFVCRKSDGTLASAANIAADIGDVEITLGGDQKIKCPAVTLQNIFTHKNGGNAAAGILSINLYAPRYDTYAQRQDIGWGMADITSANVFVNINSPGTLYVASIELMADWDETRQQVLGAHQCISYQDVTFAGSATLDVNTLNTYGVDAGIQAMHVANGTPANIFVDVDGKNIVNNLTPEMFDVINTSSNYVTVANLGTTIRFDNKNITVGVLPCFNISKLRFRATYAAAVSAGYVRFIFEYVRGIDPKVFGV
jgi:hypothetical protein